VADPEAAILYRRESADGAALVRHDCYHDREGRSWIHVRGFEQETEASVPLRNEANEPPVVKNVCAVLTGRKPKPKHTSMSRARGTCGTFLIFFKFRSFWFPLEGVTLSVSISIPLAMVMALVILGSVDYWHRLLYV
jgi:hypothetical protein